MYSVLRLRSLRRCRARRLLRFPRQLSAISTDAAEVQLQLAKLLFTDGRYIEAFSAYEQIKAHDDARIKREALHGQPSRRPCALVISRTRMPTRSSWRASRAEDAESMATYGDALWAVGLFEESEAKFQDALAIQRRQRPRAARAGPQPCRTQQADRSARHGAGGAQQGSARRRVPPHGRARSTSECGGTKKRPTRTRATSICCPTRIAAPKPRGRAPKCGSCVRSVRGRRCRSIQARPASCTPSRSACSTRRSSSRRR